MKLKSNAFIELETDDAVACMGRFIRELRQSAVDTQAASIDLTLWGTSARAQATIKEIRPERTKSASFQQALEAVEEVARLAPVRLKGPSIHVCAGAFRWKGSPPDGSASLSLHDSKIVRRKKRFSLIAQLQLEAQGLYDGAAARRPTSFWQPLWLGVNWWRRLGGGFARAVSLEQLPAKDFRRVTVGAEATFQQT